MVREARPFGDGLSRWRCARAGAPGWTLARYSLSTPIGSSSWLHAYGSRLAWSSEFWCFGSWLCADRRVQAVNGKWLRGPRRRGTHSTNTCSRSHSLGKCRGSPRCASSGRSATDRAENCPRSPNTSKTTEQTCSPSPHSPKKSGDRSGPTIPGAPQ
jgi:hypothetical protein